MTRASWHRRDVLALVAWAGVGAIGCRPRDRGSLTSTPVNRTAPPDTTVAEFPELHGACNGIAAPDAAEWTAHRTGVQAAMRSADVDALVVEPGAGMTYLSGVAWGRSERPFVLVLPREGDPIVVCPAFEERTAKERVGALPLVLWREHEDPFATLASAVRARLGARGSLRLAIEPATRRFVAAGVANAIARAVVVDVDVLGATRMRKRDAELVRLRRANEATKRALAAVAARIRIGVDQASIAAWTEQALLAAGMTEPWALALVGPNASFPHGTAQSRAVAAGDAVLIDTGASLFGYRSDITRTFVVGDVPEPVGKAWTTVARAQQAAFAVLRPGARCGDADAAAREVMRDAGYGADDRYFTHRLGHGIGLEVHEPPYLVGRSEVVLDVGMTMSNEPGLYVPGAFGIRLEDIVAITKDGADVFGPWPEPLQPLRG